MKDVTNIKPTKSQQLVLDKMKAFLKSDDKVFVLKGYAGTGKTTVMRFLVKELQKGDRNYHLLASTGRASAVLHRISGDDAQTIHSLVYKYKDFNQDVSKMDVGQSVSGQLYLVFEPCVADVTAKRHVYIVDEASMVSDTEARYITQATFGTGRLLKELLEYDRDPGAQFILVGDPCQLPPINQVYSPALSASYIKSTFGCGVQEASLTEISRQGDGNSIIDASQRVRKLYASAHDSVEHYGCARYWGKLPLGSSTNIKLHPNN